MSELAELFVSLGHEDVRTYIQSGNVVFSTPAAAGGLAPSLEEAIRGRFGLEGTVVLRTPAELRRIAQKNPFPHTKSSPTWLHVVFFATAPDAGASARLDPERSRGD